MVTLQIQRGRRLVSKHLDVGPVPAAGSSHGPVLVVDGARYPFATLGIVSVVTDQCGFQRATTKRPVTVQTTVRVPRVTLDEIVQMRLHHHIVAELYGGLFDEYALVDDVPRDHGIAQCAEGAAEVVGDGGQPHLGGLPPVEEDKGQRQLDSIGQDEVGQQEVDYKSHLDEGMD